VLESLRLLSITDFMLIVSVVYRRFGDHEEIEFEKIRKNSIYGNTFSA